MLKNWPGATCPGLSKTLSVLADLQSDLTDVRLSPTLRTSKLAKRRGDPDFDARRDPHLHLRPKPGATLVLNFIWLSLVLAAVIAAAWTGRMGEVSRASLESAKTAIELIIGLTGGMIFFLGLVKIASDGGLLRGIIRLMSPILRRLFPEVPQDHPAMKAILMNFSANVLGLGNAATPFGLKAMAELDKLNSHRGSVTNAMALFLAINTSSIVLLPPTGTVMVRLAAGSEVPFAIWLPTLFATICSTLVAVAACLLFQNMSLFRPKDKGSSDSNNTLEALPEIAIPESPAGGFARSRLGIALAIVAIVVAGLALEINERLSTESMSDILRLGARDWLLPLLIASFVLIGFVGRVRVYDALIEGGREGLSVAVRIAPYLVAIMVAIGMFRASGGLEILVGALEPLARLVGAPAEALPMAILRPLSGSGAFGVMSETLTVHGPDSFIGLVTSTLQGSTETTFYVLAIYLGAAGIRDARHVLPACLLGDVAGFIGAVAACHFFFS